MAIPAHLLDRLSGLPAGVLGVPAPEPANAEAGLELGIPALDAVLPDRGLPRGAVVELSVSGDSALATSIALSACRAAQREALARGGSMPWCAFVDPSATLYGPGVAAAGVELERLLVVRPTTEALSRVALRLAEAQAFALVVVDLAGMPGQRVSAALGVWPRVIRRLSMAVSDTRASVLLITSSADPRPLPLPVAQRIELRRTAPEKLVVRIAKDRRGRISAPRPIVWTRESSRESASSEGAGNVRRLA
jgi:hypothetical protein